MKLHVITPIGPGHEAVVNRALDSVRIAMEYHTGPFSDVLVRTIDDSDGSMGRSKARNTGVEGVGADWIFFLDADDVMHPEALQNVAPFIDRYDALWGAIWELKAGVMYPRYQIPAIGDYEMLLKNDPYLTLQMGHFVRTEVARKLPFAEHMDTGEDWDYYLRVWKDYRCRKIQQPFHCNIRGGHSTGPRGANGIDWRAAVEGQITQAKGALDASRSAIGA